MPGAAIVIPQAGDEITSTWGASVAQGLNGIQAGTVSVTRPAGSAAGTQLVTFPKPFASAPTVVASPAGTSGVLTAGAQNVTATGFTAFLNRIDGNVSNPSTQIVAWIAVGTLA